MSRHISEARRKYLIKRIGKARTTKAPENAVGQWIASFFEAGVKSALETIVSKIGPQFSVSPPNKVWRLPNIYGETRQIDHIISRNGKPIVIIEDKWLKDQRHLKDKGSWIIAMQGVQKANPSIRGIVAVLAGEWNENTIRALQKVAYVIHVPIDKVYGELRKAGIDVQIDQERNAFMDPAGLLENILDIVEENLSKDIDIISDVGDRIFKDKVKQTEQVIRQILLPERPSNIKGIEVTIKADSGECFAYKFNDLKTTIDFLRQFDIAKIEELMKKQEEKDTLLSYLKEQH